MSSQVILSGFADEAANEKLAIQQFSALAAAGLTADDVAVEDDVAGP